MFATTPVYNSANESEDRIINPSHIEEVYPHANVAVDTGAVDTECCEVRYYSGTTSVILLPLDTMKVHLQALTGIITEDGALT